MIILLAILKMLGLTILQNASFTLVSRARNSPSIMYHGIASVFSNGIWLLVIREVTLSFGTWYLMIAYVIGAVIGSISMHYVSMRYFEKSDFKWKLLWTDIKGLIYGPSEIITSDIKNLGVK